MQRTCTCTCTGVGAHTVCPSECSAEEHYNNSNHPAFQTGCSFEGIRIARKKGYSRVLATALNTSTQSLPYLFQILHFELHASDQFPDAGGKVKVERFLGADGDAKQDPQEPPQRHTGLPCQGWVQQEPGGKPGVVSGWKPRRTQSAATNTTSTLTTLPFFNSRRNL